ncbi:MAG: hypothetical protein CV087_12735 [Candidatus Brocadia sp. WS118]|nr:MAG: hypothetical protein CV087_12735 [Candidatus Brocadia sp. WS118]
MKLIKSLNLFLPMVIIAATSQLVYLNSLSNHFAYDDEFTIVNNYFIKTWTNLPSLFSRAYFKYSGELSYRPVVTLSYFIDYALWQLNPLGFHLTNSILHTFNAVFLFFLSMQLFNGRVIAFLAAILFACHPVLSEAVNAVSYREDLLGTAFIIVAFFLYLSASKKELPFSRSYFCSVVCYLFGLFSKEITITLPFLIFIYDILLAKKRNHIYRLLCNYSGYICITILYLAIRFVILHNPAESHVSYPGDSVLVNYMTMTKVLASYMKLLFFPFSLCADYVMPHSYSFLDMSFVLSFLLLSSVIIIVMRMYSCSKTAFFSFLWFIISLLPVLNIVPIENIMAERYLYLPALGFCMLAGNLSGYDKSSGFFGKSLRSPYRMDHGHADNQRAGIKEYRGKVGGHVSHYDSSSFVNIVAGKERAFLRNTVAVAMVTLVGIIFSITVVRRNYIWIDQTVLWTNTAKISPDSFKSHNNLGNLFRDAGRFDEAIVELKHALQLYDKYIDAHNNLGVTYRKKGMINEALSEYQRALQLNPHYPYAHNNLGVLYAKSGFLDLAIGEFTKAITDKPDYFDAHNNLGATYIKKGLYEKAADECLEAIKYNNRYKDAYYNLAAAYFNSKQFDKALDASKRVLFMDPNHHDAHEIINLIRKQKGHAEKQ